MSWDNDTRDALIEILVAPGVDDLNDSPRFNQMKQQFLQGHLFYRIADRVQRVCGLLAVAMSQCGSSQAQVSTCLEQQLGYLLAREVEEMHVCRQAGLRGWSDTWSPAQVEYFHNANELLDRGLMDYFLSFTGRDPTTLNTMHAGLVISRFSSDLYAADKGRKNLLAAAMNRIFEDYPLSGYYYHDCEDDNRLLDAELRRECARCLVLVQIVQRRMFEGPTEENYCYLEFKAFKEGRAAQMLGVENAIKFVLGGDCTYDEIKNKRPIPPTYQEWHNLVKAKKVLTVPPSDTAEEFGEATAAAREKIRELAGQVAHAREQLLMGVPE